MLTSTDKKCMHCGGLDRWGGSGGGVQRRVLRVVIPLPPSHRHTLAWWVSHCMKTRRSSSLRVYYWYYGGDDWV